MSTLAADEMNVLRLTLHGRLVGYLAGFHDGRIADDFKSDAARPTFSLITHPEFPLSEKADGGFPRPTTSSRRAFTLTAKSITRSA